MTIPQRLPVEVPAAIAPLAVLPVFLTLAGRRAIVAGGSPAAAWKAELLAAAGAEISVVAPDPSPEMAAAIARSGGRIVHTAGTLAAALAEGAAVAVIDAADDAGAAAFCALCRAAGVPHNVIDRPAFGDFQFGAIVNRSPVVIAISTAGAAPILGQAIRQRIEAVLPAALAGWARLAAQIRDRVSRALAPGAERRRFWERLAGQALADPLPAGDPVDDWIEAARGVGRPVGAVTLVGAGPGDPGHLTLRAVQALQAADVILFDDLVTPQVLELARREATRIAVGKRNGLASCRQEDIVALMVELAGQGRRIVRLKSGDPAIFGRAGEEIAALDAAGIAVEMVPGITAASALAGRLGVSLTHRDHAQSVRFVTGHARDGTLPEHLDWRGLADPHTSLVVYMAGATASALARRLIRHGLDAATPVVLAEAVSRPGERLASLDLRALARGGPAIADGPVLLGIGAVFAPRPRPRLPTANAPAAASPVLEPTLQGDLRC